MGFSYFISANHSLAVALFNIQRTTFFVCRFTSFLQREWRHCAFVSDCVSICILWVLQQSTYSALLILHCLIIWRLLRKVSHTYQASIRCSNWNSLILNQSYRIINCFSSTSHAACSNQSYKYSKMLVEPGAVDGRIIFTKMVTAHPYYTLKNANILCTNSPDYLPCPYNQQVISFFAQ